MFNRRAVGVAITVASVVAGAALVGTGSAAANTTDCAYQVSRHTGLAGGSEYGIITDTDGVEYFTGFGYLGTPQLSYPQGNVWRDDSMIVDYGRLMPVEDINRSGVSVGHYQGILSVVSPEGQPRALAKPPQQTRWGIHIVGITDSGEIIGSMRVNETTVHGVSWSASSPNIVRDLGTAAHFAGLRNAGDTGEIVGAVRSGTALRAYAGTVTGVTLLGGVDPNRDSQAIDIAGSYVLGTGTIPGQAPGNILWHNGTPTRLPGSGTVTDVNRNGDVSGFETINGLSQPFVIRGGVRTPLPLLNGTVSAQANAITDDGRVGGSSSATGFQPQPVVWTCS